MLLRLNTGSDHVRPNSLSLPKKLIVFRGIRGDHERDMKLHGCEIIEQSV